MITFVKIFIYFQYQKILKKKYGFATATSLLNEDATRAKILETLDKVAAEMEADDKLLIFYSGHGIELGEEGYWVPFEAKSKERYELLATSEVKTALSKAASRHILVMVDACFSSTFGSDINNAITRADPKRKYLPSKASMQDFQKEELKYAQYSRVG